ncbi:MAG: alpha/beta hydrolase [gamma proteobacterium symbiont of Taylorina sp.]|nr:alpha/beta hydrolase [gamma proteobacterium symbiont of Taylorina sp.]
MKKIFNLLRMLISIYVLVGIMLFVFQRNFIYYPTTKISHTFQVKSFSVDEETVEVIILNKGKNNAIMYFGGNGESVVRNAPDFIKTFPNHTLYLVNYRGYGGSTGNPTEQALYSDAQHIYDEIENQHQKISVIGRSLGTGIATFLASKRKIHKIALVTPYDSIEHIAQDQYKIYPISILLQDKYNSFHRIKEIKSDALIILAEHDMVIPLKYSTRLIKAFPASQVTVETIKGVGHNNLSQKEKYYQLLKQFL